MAAELTDADLIFQTVHSDSKKNLPDQLHLGKESLRNYRILKTLPDLGLPSVDLNLLLIFINAENNRVISSNEKKVINLLILGDKESVDPKKILYCDPVDDKVLYSYFENLKKDKSQNGKAAGIYYRPGRSVARYQLWKLGQCYGYTNPSINKALKNLTEKGFIEYFPVNESKQNKYDRFKLSVQGCADYLKRKEEELKSM